MIETFFEGCRYLAGKRAPFREQFATRSQAEDWARERQRSDRDLQIFRFGFGETIPEGMDGIVITECRVRTDANGKRQIFE